MWTREAGKGFKTSSIMVDSPCTVSNSLPKTIHSAVRQQFLVDREYICPETFVATIPRGRLLSRGVIVAPDGQLLRDVSMYFCGPNLSIPSAVSLDWKLEHLTDVYGRVAVLTTDGADLYYHWLFQLLPRFELMRRAGINVDEIDYFAVNSLKSRFQQETLATLGVDRSRIITNDRLRHVRAEELIVPSIPLADGCFRPWMLDFLRASFLSNHCEAIKAGRRLYISRSRAGYRRIVNEVEVVRLLRRRGFETTAFEELSVQEQATTMASCEAVVAPHGGGLSNIVFCPPGAKVIEIFSPELVAGYFWKLSNQARLDYYYLLGKGSPETLSADYPQSWDAGADIEVDLELLERTLSLANIA
jgi:hypothetical protein